jgi:hypothetical protein
MIIGFAITGLASFNNLADISSLPVAFLTLVLFICLCTNSSDISSGYGCNTTLLKNIEDWKQVLDQNKYIAAVLMDLSKAFDVELLT